MSEVDEPFIPRRLPNESDEALGHRMGLFVETIASRLVSMHRKRIIDGSEDDISLASGIMRLEAVVRQHGADGPLDGDEDPDTEAALARFWEYRKKKDAQLLDGDPDAVYEAISGLALSMLINESPIDPTD